MATLTVETASAAGLEATFNSCAGGGDEFENNGATYLIFKNGDASSKTITVVSQKTVGGLAVADQAIVVGAGEERVIGPLPKAIYNDIDGNVQLTYSAVTSCTIAVFSN